MNEHTMNIDDLISQYIDGALSGEAEAELHHRLSVSPDDRRRFREQIMLRGVARDGRMLDRPSPRMRSDLFARLKNDEGMSAAAAAAAIAAPTTVGDPAPTGSVAPSAAPRPTAGDRPAAVRPENGRERRRRRLVPMLLPFLVGVIITAGLWSVLDEPAMKQEMAAQVDTGAPVSGGPFALPGEPMTDAGVPEESASSNNADAAAGGASSATASSAAASSEATTSDIAASESDARRGSAATLSASAEPSRTSTPPSRPTARRRYDEALAVGEERLRSDGFGNDGGFGGGAADGAAASRAFGGPDGAGRSEEDATLAAAPIEAPAFAAEMAPETEQSVPPPSAAVAPESVPPDSPIMTDRVAITNRAAKSSLPTPTAISATDARSEPRAEPRAAETREASPATARDLASDVAPDGASNGAGDGAGAAQGAAVSQMADSTPPVALSSVLAPTSKSGVRINGADNIGLVEQAPERGIVFTTGLRQSMLVGLREREARPEIAVRIAGELGNGMHEIAAVVGYTTFRESRRRTADEFRYDASMGEYLFSSEQTAEDETRSEVFGGLGYRVHVLRGERWQAGLGTWGGYGSRYARAGAELPIAYRVSQRVRIELTPALQYVSAHGSASDVITTTSTPSPGTRQVVTEQTEVNDGELRAGVGLGVTVTIY